METRAAKDKMQRLLHHSPGCSRWSFEAWRASDPSSISCLPCCPQHICATAHLCCSPAAVHVHLPRYHSQSSRTVVESTTRGCIININTEYGHDLLSEDTLSPSTPPPHPSVDSFQSLRPTPLNQFLINHLKASSATLFIPPPRSFKAN